MEKSCGRSFCRTDFLLRILPELSVAAAVQTIFDPSNKEALATAYPLIFNILAHIAVLPASNANVECLFSTMKRMKTTQRNRL